VPADPDCAFAPLGRPRSALEAAGAATAYATILAGLAFGSGLCQRLLLGAGRPVAVHPRDVRTGLM